jgi:hypothetical protein
MCGWEERNTMHEVQGRARELVAMGVVPVPAQMSSVSQLVENKSLIVIIASSIWQQKSRKRFDNSEM